MGKRDKKKKRDKKQGTAVEKAEARQDKAAKKTAKKNKDADEDDIERLIAEFKKKDAEKTAVTESVNPAPVPRMNASFLPTPGKDNELILFGGESFEEDRVVVYNDLFRYNLKKQEWKKIESPNTPAPRCSHQAVCSKNFMYVFGGEFTSPSQSQFYHYRDTWKLNVDTNQWTEVQSKGGSPPARSGHRMQLWKQTRYFNDLWMFDIDSEKWTKVEAKNAISGNIPSPRSGCITGVYGDYFFILRGYSLEKKTKDSAPKATVHTDAWAFHLVDLTWEKLKTPGTAPSEMSGVVDRTRILTFGGVFDVETKDNLQSTFFNDMYQFHMDSRRWFPLALNKKKKKEGATEDAGDDEESETPAEEPSEIKDDKPVEEKAQSAESVAEEPKAEEKEEQEDSEEEEERGKGKKSKKKGKGKQEEPKEEEEEKGGKGKKGKGKEKGKGKQREEEEEEASKSKGKGKDTKGKRKEVDRPSADKKLEGLKTSSSAVKPAVPTSPTPAAPSKLAASTDSVASTNSTTSTSTAATVPEDALIPCARINPHLAVIGHTLYVYGGIVERQDREVIFSDLHALNLHKLDTFECIIESQSLEWDGGAAEEDDDDDEDEDEDEDENDSEDEEEEEEEDDDSDSDEEDAEKELSTGVAQLSVEATTTTTSEEKAEGAEDEEGEVDGEESEEEATVAQSSVGGVVNVKTKTALVRGRYGKREKLKAKLAKYQDGTPLPNTRETLREFFERTAEGWTPFAIKNLRAEQQLDVKELRREGFLLAEVRYNALKPLIAKMEKLEDEEEESRKVAEKKKAYESRSLDVRVKEKLKEKKEKSRR